MLEDESPKLFHCIYTSAATSLFKTSDLQAILASSRVNNERLGISGMLLYEAGSFFQILEGLPHDVERMYSHIAADKRHASIKKIIAEPITERSFGQWTMGNAQASRDDLRRIQGLNDFFTVGTCYTDLDKGRAKILLTAFRDGQWRSRLQ